MARRELASLARLARQVQSEQLEPELLGRLGLRVRSGQPGLVLPAQSELRESELPDQWARPALLARLELALLAQ